MLTIRPAAVGDAAALSAIYAPYVRETTVTFEYDPPSAEEFAHRIRGISEKYPYFVCCDGDTPVGYAYAHAFRERAAYDWDVEMSIYVDRGHRHGGVGRMLYEALEAALREMGIVNCYACITSPNPASIAFHTALGYRELAVFPRTGFKFGRWLDVTWMVKQINPHRDEPQPVAAWGQN
ncbi:MAG: N-acetyltransferase [Clostridia bacterium]|nr:N-acetyltransferase [Clostridia bacterium]